MKNTMLGDYPSSPHPRRTVNQPVEAVKCASGPHAQPGAVDWIDQVRFIVAEGPLSRRGTRSHFPGLRDSLDPGADFANVYDESLKNSRDLNAVTIRFKMPDLNVI